ncbi:MAG: EamA family transporter [Alloprevotella sp.]
MWKYYALLSAFFAALTALFSKVGVSGVPSNLATAIRTFFILLLTWGIVWFTHEGRMIRTLPSHTWVFLLLSGVATGLSWLFYFKALQTGNVSMVAPIDKLSVVFTVILAMVFLKEPADLRTLLGTFLIVAGSLIMMWKR